MTVGVNAWQLCSLILFCFLSRLACYCFTWFVIITRKKRPCEIFFDCIIIAITVILCRIYNAISLNAVVFAAVCLASTMNAAIEGFALVSISVHIFAFAPRFNKVLHSCTNSWIECNSLAAFFVYQCSFGMAHNCVVDNHFLECCCSFLDCNTIYSCRVSFVAVFFAKFKKVRPDKLPKI